MLRSPSFWTEKVSKGLKEAYRETDQAYAICFGRANQPLPVINAIVMLLVIRGCLIRKITKTKTKDLGVKPKKQKNPKIAKIGPKRKNKA